jgi:hypothetical protein
MTPAYSQWHAAFIEVQATHVFRLSQQYQPHPTFFKAWVAPQVHTRTMTENHGIMYHFRWTQETLGKLKFFRQLLAIMSYDMILSPAEIQSLTGGYQRPKDQLAELRKQGFVRARIGMNGRVVLESAHYEAVCGGRFGLADPSAKGPRPTPMPFRKPS